MDTATENQGSSRPSGLRAPKKIQMPPSPSKSRSAALCEMTDAAANSRGAMLPPPQPMKHKPAGCKDASLDIAGNSLTAEVPEPAAKRKTLQERAGDPYNPNPAAPPNARPVNAAVKNVAANGLRNGGFSKSTSRVPPPHLSRHTSTSSFANSVGHGSRVPSANGSRPHAASYGHKRSKSAHQGSRVASTLSEQEEEPQAERKGAYNSPISISTNPKHGHSKLRPAKVRLQGRVYSESDIRTKRNFTNGHTKASLSLLPSVMDQSSPPTEPASTDDESLVASMRSLSVGLSASALRSGTTGRGTAPGKLSRSSHMSSSLLPRPTPTRDVAPSPSVSHPRTPTRRTETPTPCQNPRYLNRFTNDIAPVFDTELRVESIEREFAMFRQKMETETTQSNDLKDSIRLLQGRVNELEAIRVQLMTLNEGLNSDLKDAKKYMETTGRDLEQARRNHTYEVDDMRRKHNNEMDDMRDRYSKDALRAKRETEEAVEKAHKDCEAKIDRLVKAHGEELAQIKKKLEAEVEDERSRRTREAQELQVAFALKLQNAGLEFDTKDREAQNVRLELTTTKAELDRERSLKTALQSQLTDATSLNLTLDSSNQAMKAKIHFLESDSQAQSSAFNDLHRRMQDAIEAAELAQEKLRQEETLRRKLHNQVQELKGNIRVMCRVRPVNEATETEPAKITFPDDSTDSKEVAITGPDKQSAMGNITTQMYSYSFDRVFSPASQNGEVFEEISQLVQSALDGYNVCIFCYGQTGSGKTHTMSSVDGMIPRATAQIYAEATRLEEKGWRYKMEGTFVEVYNEQYNDLLGRSEDLDKKKVEVRHDTVKKQTTLENTVSVTLDGPDRVEEILRTASKNRSVAATKANQRSSRSHSVFILKLVGINSITGERSEGTLNLVDLAGSERLEHSKAEGARLKETQNINKSLSCLGDVINALGSAKEGSHIPYRNSKLTYLLQYSLGGNSKTLMFVMVSPLQAHLQETITSLKFATKVHNTHIGTAKKSTKSS
ncbi:kinesin-domain-containing protein [Amniculicola lignicola CBS 123094]|uniref:Kinesin-domain-containing protein n=1 Tax=Amniculicola lignicola CBS 123094 TaxID=1392246 RepID=A0A6A5WKG3_9PLEO|nr:kinesin-domain-containing protein [Amniculicola lignicola CBS 123094]